jgi:hypothetical protein
LSLILVGRKLLLYFGVAYDSLDQRNIEVSYEILVSSLWVFAENAELSVHILGINGNW